MQSFPSILVFCDLDDTLFESHSFSVDASAHRALDRIERDGVPLVLCSSKTRAELELIQLELGIDQPFICENGAAVFVPRGYFGFSVPRARSVAGYEAVEFGKRYADVVGLLNGAAGRLGVKIRGFNDMSVADVAIDCDLPLLLARLAKLREYGEPFRVIDARPGALPRLFRALNATGLDCTSRGRYHYAGANCRDGVQFLRGLYRRAFGDVITVAFGDHGSAVPLLLHAHVPLVVQSRASGETTHLLRDVPTARLSPVDSVGAWADVVLEIASAAQRSRSSCWS
jgi:mannosyl-3-phosphoglycerate phosphatase